MPNHVTNVLTLHGEPEQIRAMLEAIQYDDLGIGSVDFNTTTPYSSVTTKTECLAMRINAAAVPRALTRAIRTAACRSMPFTGMGKVTASIYLKRPSTC